MSNNEHPYMLLCQWYLLSNRQKNFGFYVNGMVGRENMLIMSTSLFLYISLQTSSK